MLLIILGSVVGSLVLFAVSVAVLYRKVVPTNEVHIVQSAKKTLSYGKDTGNGNTYYSWPSWIPLFGVSTRKLPTSVFDLDLHEYEAYDKGRLPFMVDVKSFFRIADSNIAAQRVESFQELQQQLLAIVQGAVRVILASSGIEEILQGRSTFGEQFTKEVTEHLSDWGVVTVKNIELMDIRDARSSSVIHNIMEKKKSQIEMESRSEVAKNKRIAEIAEIEAMQEVDLQKQSAAQSVGLRTIEAKRAVELKDQERIQIIKEQEKITKEKEMEVVQVEQVRTAEIDMRVQVVKAEQAKETTVINAKATKEMTTLVAEGQLEAKRREAEGIKAEGEAKADAEKSMQLAPVQAQISLAKEIGANAGYQNYLISVRQVEAGEKVGIEQAKALHQADVKIIANSGDPVSGVQNVRDLFSAKGGTEIAAMIEALSQTKTGKAIVTKITGE